MQLLNGFLKEKYQKYTLRSSKRDRFGTLVEWYEKKPGAKNHKTLKLYEPSEESKIKETTDQCRYCEGYLVWHWVVFANDTNHIQVTCSQCKRYNRYQEQDLIND